MYHRRLECIVASLCETLIAHHSSANENRTAAERDVASFVLGQVEHMPGFLRMPMIVLTVFFDYSGLLRTGRRFSRQSLDRRQSQIAAWRRSKIGPFRDFVEFYESLTVYGWYSHIHG